MAVNVPVKIYTDGVGAKVVLYRVSSFTNGDTFNVSADFVSVQASLLWGTTINFQNQPVVSASTVLTPGANSANKDDGYLVVYGAT